MKHKLLLFLSIFLLIFSSVHAQRGEVSGGIFDSINTSISYASVAVFDLRDSSVITFGLTDDGLDLN